MCRVITDGLTKWKQTKPCQFLLRPTKNKVIKIWREPEETWTLNATTVELQHPSVQSRRRSSLNKCRKRDICKTPCPRQLIWGQTGAVRARACVCEQIDFVQHMCFMSVWWLKTDKGSMCVYVPTTHPWKQTVNERTVLFIRFSRLATCSHQPRATKRPFRLSIQPLPPCWTFDCNDSESNK